MILFMLFSRLYVRDGTASVNIRMNTKRPAVWVWLLWRWVTWRVYG